MTRIAPLAVWRKHFLALEAALGAGTTALFLYLWWPVDSREWFNAIVFPRVVSLASGVSAVSASLMGFTVAALSVIVVCPENEQIRNVREKGFYRRLIRVFTSSILCTGFLVVAAFATLLVPSHGISPVLATAGLLFGGTLVALRLLRLVWVMEQVVQ
ncbi:MAG: hypothetical protein AB7N73_10045 [Gemmatimonadales bacterium]